MSLRKLPLFVLAAAAVALPLLTLASPARADGDVLDRRVDVALADTAPDQAFQGIAKMTGLDATVDPGVDGKVTVRLQNVRLRTVLDAVCESIGCRWSIASGTKLHIVPLTERSARKTMLLEEPIDLRVTGANVREVLQTFGQMLSAEVDLDPRITGKVTFEIDNVPCGKALDKVCAMAGCTWKLDTESKSPVLRIAAKR
jgi:type II secretory pathway component GspD/PulD (secretin)